MSTIFGRQEKHFNKLTSSKPEDFVDMTSFPETDILLFVLMNFSIGAVVCLLGNSQMKVVKLD